MTPKDIELFAKGKIDIVGATTDTVASEIRQDPKLTEELVRRVNLALRYLKDDKSASRARDRLAVEIDLGPKQRSVQEVVNTKRQIRALMEFLGDPTHTSKGQAFYTENARMMNYKNQLLAYAGTKPGMTNKNRDKLIAVIKAMSPEQIQTLFDTYKRIHNRTAFDFYEAIRTVGGDIIDRIKNIADDKMDNILDTLTDRFNIAETKQAIEDVEFKSKSFSIDAGGVNATQLGKRIRRKRQLIEKDMAAAAKMAAAAPRVKAADHAPEKPKAKPKKKAKKGKKRRKK